jgi:hypothetical protein
MRTGPPTVVLATTNGTGMGHLSRQLALALASLGGMDPVIFSLSSSVPVVGRYDMRAEWAPGLTRWQLPRRTWDPYLSDRIVALLAETQASAFVFDGVFPYDGVLRALRRLPDVPFIWSRRAMWQKGKNTRALRYRKLFAAVLEPGDLAAAGDVGATVGLDDARVVGPVTLVGNVHALSRSEARAELGLDPDTPAVLVTLGSNRRPERFDAYGHTVAKFIAAGWQVVVTAGPIQPRSDGPHVQRGQDGVTEISVFPLVRYLRGFDAAVSASGYNAVHELIYSLVPTLLVPHPDAVTDDQRTRARVVTGQGLALAADPANPREFEAVLERLLDPRVRKRLRAACRDLDLSTGATEAARAVIGLAAGRPAAASETVVAEALHARRFARRVAARSVPARAAEYLGRPGRLKERRTPLNLRVRLAPASCGPVPPKGEDELLVTDALTPGLFDVRRVEHLLAGASDEYVAVRAELARHYYRLRPGEPPDGSCEQALRWAKLGWEG